MKLSFILKYEENGIGTIYLNIFHRKLAISNFDKPFTPNHNSF